MHQVTSREILLTALRWGDDRMRAEQLVQATPEAWLQVPALARQHGVAPLVYWQLRPHRRLMPAPVLHALRIDYLQAANTNALLFERLAHLLDQLRQQDIPAIVLKGAYLASAIYPTGAVRPMNDIDLLVHERDLARVCELVQALGLTRLQKLEEPTPEVCHLAFHSDAQNLHLEVHWNLIPECFGVGLDIDGLWKRAEQVAIGGVPALALSPEDQLLHLSLHSALHSLGMGLRALCDVSWTIHRHQSRIDWAALHARARAWGMTRCVYVVLSLTGELLNTWVPEDSLAPKGLEAGYLAMARDQIYAGVEASGQAIPSSATLVDIWADKTVMGRVQRLSRSFFPSRRLMAMIFPIPHDSPRIWLYYPVRWKDLLQRYGHLAWFLARGDPETLSRAQRQKQVNALRDWMLSS